MGKLVPVDYDPFADEVTTGKLVPVDFNPFAYEELTTSPALIKHSYAKPIQTADFYTTMKAERMGLIKPSGIEDRLAQASVQAATEKRIRERREVVAELQYEIDNGNDIDPDMMLEYGRYLKFPEMEKPRAQPKAATTKAKPEPVVETPQPVQPEAQFAPSNIIGDDARAMASLSLGVAEAGLSAVKGLTDLNESIPVPQFIRNTRDKIAAATGMDKLPAKLNNLISEVGMYRGQIKDEIVKESGGGKMGIAAKVASDIADSAAVTALTLAGLGASGFVGKGATIRSAIVEAAKFGGFTYATTPGTQEEKLKAAAHSAAFMLTPIPAAKMPTSFLAKAVNIAENIGINTPTYLAAVKQAKANAASKGTPDEWVSELVSTATPILVNDIIFGMAVQSKKAVLGKENKAIVDSLIANAPEGFLTPITKGFLTPEQLRKPTRLEVPKEMIPREVPRATQEGQVPEVNISQRIKTDARGIPAETGGGNRPVERGVEPKAQEIVPEPATPPVKPSKVVAPIPEPLPVADVKPNAKEAKPLTDFEVRYTTKDGNRGKTWVQAEDAQLAVSKAQKQFNEEGTGDKVTSAVKSKMPMTEPIAKPSEPGAQVKGPGLKDSMGAASIGLPSVTVSTAEPGRQRLKGLLETAKQSATVSDPAKAELAKRDPNYEQQKTKTMKQKVLTWFAEKKSSEEMASRVQEAETMVRDPAEDLDTKGAVGIALLEHYRNTGNDAASVAMVEHLDPLMRGAGRLNQAASMLNQLTGKGWITKINEYLVKNNAKLPDDIRKQVELELKLAAGMKDEASRQEAIHKTLSKVVTYVPFKMGEWLDAYRYTNMLSNPQSHERNVYGNLIQAFVTRPLSLAAGGNFRGARTYLAGAWRNAMSGDAFRTAATSANKDFSKFAESMDDPNASILDAIRHEQGPQGKGKQIAWKSLTAIPKFLNAQDLFFGSLINSGETARLSKTGKSPEAIQDIAKRLEDEYLYRNKLNAKKDTSQSWGVGALDGFANLMEAGRKNEHAGVRWPMKLVVPFLRTPVRIAQFGLKSSPLAYLGGSFKMKDGKPSFAYHMTVDSIAKSKYGQEFSKLSESEKFIVKEDLQNRKGLAAVGTMVSLAGLGMALTGATTWGTPQDKKAKEQFYASGRRPYSFKVGDKWIPMSYLGPWFLAFALPAAARDAISDNPKSADENFVKKLGIAAGGIPKIILSQTPLAGVAGLIDALQGKMDTNVSAALGFQATQFIPGSGLIRWINKIVDPTYRKPVTITETIEAGIPGLSQDVKAYQDTNKIDATRPWTDIYLPYTVGTEDTANENKYMSRMDLLRRKMKDRKKK
jgi:hypothetical protein